MPVARPVLLLCLLAGLLVMAMDFKALREVTAASDPVERLHSSAAPPWGGYALQALARQTAPFWGLEPQATSELLQAAAKAYPLDAHNWLNQARIEATRHGAESLLLDHHLLTATAIQPRNRNARWSAAQIAMQARDYALADFHLKRWLLGAPGDARLALLIARRWITEPEDLLDRILPPGNEFLDEAMNFAHQQRDLALADVVWRRVSQRVDLNDPILLGYVEFLLNNNLRNEAIGIWELHDDHYRFGDIANGDFSRPLGDGRGLNWRVGRLPAGVRVIRDESEYRFHPASLRVEFGGDNNLQLSAPWIRIPVIPGRQYELSGHWRAENLTTRALPYWQIEAEGARMNQRVPLPRNSFDWAPWSIDFTVPEGVEMIRLRLRRDSTNAFDRYIDGILWLDGMGIRELVADPDAVSAIGEAR